MTQTRQKEANEAYIKKLETKSERQLKTMLDILEKEVKKIEAEKLKLEAKKKDKIDKGHFIKDALMEKWRNSQEILEAKKEVERGETTTYNNVDEMMKDLKNEI